MRDRAKLLGALTVILLSSAGCSGAGPTEVSPSKDQQLRNSFSRALSPEEVAKLKGSGGAGPMAQPPKRNGQ